MYEMRICDKCGSEIERFAPEILSIVKVIDLSRNPTISTVDRHYCSTDCYKSDTKSMQDHALRRITGNDTVNPSLWSRITNSLLRNHST